MLMSCGRSSALETGVVTLVAAGPSIVPSWKLGTRVGMWPLRADWLAPEFGDCAGDLGDLQQGSDELGMGRGHLVSERAVGDG